MRQAVTFYWAAAVWKQLKPVRLDVYNAIGSLALLDRPFGQSLMTERIHSARAGVFYNTSDLAATWQQSALTTIIIKGASTGASFA
jgi:hypothetical protein